MLDLKATCVVIVPRCLAELFKHFDYGYFDYREIALSNDSDRILASHSENRSQSFQKSALIDRFGVSHPVTATPALNLGATTCRIVID